jgi:hypothetical protein
MTIEAGSCHGAETSSRLVQIFHMSRENPRLMQAMFKSTRKCTPIQRPGNYQRKGSISRMQLKENDQEGKSTPAEMIVAEEYTGGTGLGV